MSARRTLYAVAGAALGLGAPAGLLFMRLMRRGLGVRSAIEEIRNDRETYVYSAASTSVAFALFGGILGRYADRLARLATTDPLTDLSNARVFHERLRQELGRVDRYRDSLSLLILDLDSLKRINDRYGHQAATRPSGRWLTPFGTACAKSISARDWAVMSSACWRRGRTRNPRGSSASLRALVRTSGGVASSLGATVSIGIASLGPSSGASPPPGVLMEAADEALYQAKREGGDRVAVRQDGGLESSSSWARRYS